MLRTLCAVILFAAVAFGCERAPTASVVAGGAADDDTVTGAVSPRNDRDAQRAKAWAEATEGIAFENGRVVVTQPIRDGNANTFDKAGADFMKINGRTRAIGAYARAVRANPKSADGYRKLAVALTTKGKTDLSIAAYATALDLDPEHVVTRMDLADALDRANRRDEAVAEMERVLATKPNTGRAHRRLAVWRYYRGEHEAARLHVAAAAAAGDPAPPQLIGLIEKAEQVAPTVATERTTER